MTRAWTVGIVNYRSAVYIAWQLKILYEANPPESFELLLVDNSQPPERAELERLAAPYAARHRNIELVFHLPKPGAASNQHGEGLELIRARARTPYLLVQDPDFFWVRRDYLALLAELIERGNLAVGAPYPEKVGLGDPWFPAAFGSAFRRSALEGLDFNARATADAVAESFARWPQADGYGFSFDVGWRVREILSDHPHLAFEQRVRPDLGRDFGSPTFTILPREYRHDGRALAYHLFRGTFTGGWSEAFADPGHDPPAAWREARDRIGAHFYALLKRDRRSLLRDLGRLLGGIGRSGRGPARSGAPSSGS